MDKNQRICHYMSFYIVLYSENSSNYMLNIIEVLFFKMVYRLVRSRDTSSEALMTISTLSYCKLAACLARPYLASYKWKTS